ncbi:MAG: exonuclease domain-containing protein [Proteobacteria bacterium]|nr:exonuclease domain-containing protein [Pseudomonadota bacterium]
MLTLRHMTCLFIDLQATGASPNHGRLLELGWCLARAANDGTDTVTLRSLLVDPQQPIPRQISRVTGITQGMLAQAVTPAEAIHQLHRDAASASVMVAHVARYEASFLLPLWREHLGVELAWPILCTHQIAQRLIPTLPSLSLRAVAGHCGYGVDRERRSAGHVLATAAVWRRVCEILEQDTSVRTLSELQDWLKQAKSSAKRPRIYPMARDLRLRLPDQPGIYRMCDASGRILYVGKALSLKSRVNSYFRHRRGHGANKLEMLSQVASIDIEATATGVEAALLESDEIKRLDPPYNIALRRLDRRAAFVDHQLRPSSDLNQSTLFGPYARPEPMVIPHMIAAAMNASTPADDPVFGRLADLLREGEGDCLTRTALDLFRQIFGLNSPSARQLLTHGLWNQRREAAQSLAESLLTATAETETETEVDAEVDTDQQLTAEQLVARMQQLLVSAARDWLRGRRLQPLFNSQITWSEGEGEDMRWRQLTLEHGLVIDRRWLTSAEYFASQYDGRPQPMCQWSSDIAVYDRVRILLTEINRLRAEGAMVDVRT